MSFENITDIEWAYLAGILDGEGCIALNKQRTKRNGKVYSYYTLFVTVGNTDYSLIKWLSDTFGGKYYPSTRKENRRQVWTWCVASQKAEDMLNHVRKYMIVKKDQAELAIVFRNTYKGIRPCMARPLPVSVVEFRENCVNEMRILKRQKPFPVEAA